VLVIARAHEHRPQVPTLVIISSVYHYDVPQSCQLGASAVLNQALSLASLRKEPVRIRRLKVSPSQQ
jgi:hypothetical protein